MKGRSAIADLVGREDLVGRLADVVERAVGGERATAVVAGQAGIGKTSLVRAAAALAAERGVRIGWGTAVEGDGAPGYWPWTQALNTFARSVGLAHAGALAGHDRSLLATIATAFGASDDGGASGQAQLLLMDATARWLDALASDAPLMIVLDDLQWADDSSLALFDFVARSPSPAAVCLVGAYRHDELVARSRTRMSTLLTRTDRVHVEGIDHAAVRALVEQVVGATVPAEVIAAIHHRSAGHPFFVRELALLSMTSGATASVPVAIREAIERRLRQLPEPTLEVLAVAAVAGAEVVPDVVAGALAVSTVDVEIATRDAVAADVLVVGDNNRLRFAHDLFRETVEARLDLSSG